MDGSKGLLEWIWLQIQVSSTLESLRAWNGVFGIRSGGSVRRRLFLLLMMVVMMLL